MPPNATSLSQTEVTDVLAYLLSRNVVENSETPLPIDIRALANYTIPAQKIVNRRFSPRTASFSTNGPVTPVSRLNTLSPVTDEMLLNPPADDKRLDGVVYLQVDLRDRTQLQKKLLLSNF